MSERRARGSDMRANGPPPDASACLYEGKVMHQRMRPFGHRFNYRVFSLLVDLDRLAEADGLSRLFSVNRFNWLSFHERDHLDEGEQGLAETTRRRFREAGLATPLSRVVLVCYPRIFGAVFNPLAVYYGYDADGVLRGMIYEVSNTFGGRHRYVMPLREGELQSNGVRQDAQKVFRVSPFIEMDMHYHFRMLPPGEEIRWRILETDAEGPLLSATYSGSVRPLTTAAIAGLCARVPFLTATILAGIHWEALKIWLKGAKFIPESKKLIPAPELTQLPTAKLRTRMEPEAAGFRSCEEGNGQGLNLQLKR